MAILRVLQQKAWNCKIWFVLVGIIVLWPLVYPEKFYLHMGIFFFLHVIGAMSLNLVMRAGLISFAHGTFFGLGAYTSTLLMMELKIPFLIAFPLAGLVPAIMSLIVGPIILRLRGVYFVLISFVFGEIIRLFFVAWESLTGGSNGIYDIPPPALDILFFSISLSSKISIYYFSMIIAGLTCAACISLNKSQFGRALISIEEGEILAECSGVNTLKYKILAFSIGAFMTGLGGSIFAHYMRYISPIDFTWKLGLDFIAYNVVGGMLTNAGPIVGAAVIVPLPEFLRGAVEFQWIIYSIIIILMILFVPEGLSGLYQRISKYIVHRTKQSEPGEAREPIT